MVDVDRESRGVKDLRIGTEPALVCAIDGKQHSVAHVLRELAVQLRERHECVLAGKRRLTRDVHVGILAELAQGERHGE